jgi:phospholipid-transporting ATPase
LDIFDDLDKVRFFTVSFSMSVKKKLIYAGLAQPELNKTFVPKGSRNVYVNDPVKQRQFEYLHNKVTTAKYNSFTFIPKFLIEFFSKYSNLFFLFTGSIQLIGNLSPTSRYGTAIPLLIIAIFTGTKELLEDAKRHSQDYLVNNRSTKVLSGDHFIEKKWKEVVVGDIVRVENAEFFPCDLVLVSSSEPDALCYIETSNLDG